MSLVVFQHESFEDAARLGRTLADHGHKLRVIKLYDGQPVPPDLDNVDGVISMGGTMNVDQADKHPWMKPEMDYIRKAHEAGKPVVGLCLGHQLIAAAFGGEVGAMEKPEIGWEPVKLSFPGTIDTLHAGIPWSSTQFHFHGQEVKKLPDGATPLAASQACKIQAFKIGMRTYAFQYHFEWTLEDITRFAKLPWVANNGYDTQQILEQAKQDYDNYRRLGDRLCESIASYLFPLDKR